jgi:hypothetical protein
MDFSWKALILAPLALPLLFTALLTFSSPGKNPVTGFLFLLALGSLLSYGITIFLFLPALFVVSKFRPLTAKLTPLIGAVVGLLVYPPFIWQEYKASGVDSGPPEGTFGEYLRQHAFGSDFWALLLAGFATAMLYWFLSKQPSSKRDPSTA